MALESYFEEHAQEVLERNWMSLEMQTTLLNTFPQKLIATILKALREQLNEGGKFWDDVNGGYLPEDLVSAARREESDWVHSKGVYEIVPMQECRDAGMKPWGLICLDTRSVDPTRKKIRSRLCAREYKNEEAR